MSSYVTIIIIVAVIVAFILIISYVKTPPKEAMIISGLSK